MFWYLASPVQIPSAQQLLTRACQLSAPGSFGETEASLGSEVVLLRLRKMDPDVYSLSWFHIT